MGAKTAILAFADGDIRSALAATPSDPDKAEALVRRVFPGYAVAPADGTTLRHGVYPGDDVTYVAALAGVELFCDRRLMFARPSELPARFHELADGRRIVLHGMHSVGDWLGFAVWEDGRLIRSLSLDPNGGVQENIGEPFEFELPYWAGEHPVKPIPGWPNQRPYPLPFHPLELGGQDAMRALFGFIVEGRPHPDDVDVDSIPMLGFRATDPSGREQAARDAMLEHARHMTRRSFRLGPDGTLIEVDLNNP